MCAEKTPLPKEPTLLTAHNEVEFSPVIFSQAPFAPFFLPTPVESHLFSRSPALVPPPLPSSLDGREDPRVHNDEGPSWADDWEIRKNETWEEKEDHRFRAVMRFSRMMNVADDLLAESTYYSIANRDDLRKSLRKLVAEISKGMKSLRCMWHWKMPDLRRKLPLLRALVAVMAVWDKKFPPEGAGAVSSSPL